ncbi:hypothetical protein GCM10011614_33370 [Novosphingobium colocasiae]|uniref:Fumarylacetoacetase N-terminal domain-containing protein n=1 Tax=Novosphingobium colocasiae TaxID=1256513 RepID=A0A918PMB6_9SPHN|nr:hypothetical protein GCM10011614_33370 [Novosphingobium colocasiae]
MDFTHDPALGSWVPGATGHPDFPIQNLPFGIFASSRTVERRIGIAIGDHILDLAAVAMLLPDGVRAMVGAGEALALNALFAHGPVAMIRLRQEIARLLSDAAHEQAVRPALYPARECVMHLPFAIGDDTDFYTGIRHAENVGRLLRPDNPLLPNYKYVPIGYHGRASSIRLSEVDVRRPSGQFKAPDAGEPVFAPTARLDYELEMGIWIG